MTDHLRNRVLNTCAALALSLLLLAATGGCSSDDDDVYNSEGTKGTPEPLGSPSISYPGSVGSDGSYYSVNVVDTTDYKVSLSGLKRDADLHVYGISDFFSNPNLCDSITVGTGPESCTATADGATMYIYIRSLTEQGTDFTLIVELN